MHVVCSCSCWTPPSVPFFSPRLSMPMCKSTILHVVLVIHIRIQNPWVTRHVRRKLCSCCFASPPTPLPHVFRPGQACSFVNLLSSTHFFVQGQTCAFVTSPFPFLVQNQSCQCVHLLSFMYFWSRMWILISPQITHFCFFWSLFMFFLIRPWMGHNPYPSQKWFPFLFFDP